MWQSLEPIRRAATVEDVLEELAELPPIVIGTNDNGDAVIGDLAEMGSLLIAGATGSGKSTFLDSMIISLSEYATPDELRLILVDPKRAEFWWCENNPLLYIPVIHSAHETMSALAWCQEETNRRRDAFYPAKVNDTCNMVDCRCTRMGVLSKKLPEIVMIIDEFSDLMAIYGSDFEHLVCRIGQLGGDVGIHLVMATQNPSIHVVTGLIKACIPNRVALRVASETDSRIIIDESGAENLTGFGDLLLAKPGMPSPVHIQGCRVSQGDVESCAEKWKGEVPASRHRSSHDLPFIYLLDHSASMVAAWELAFEHVSSATAVKGDFARFMDEHPEVDCVVSPANSYGIMDGAYDLAIIRYYGEDLMAAVQKKILNEWLGEQPIGTSVSVDCEGITLIHTPTMRIPSTIVDPMVVYHAMRSTLIEAMRRGIKTMVVPAFGAGCGMLPFDTVAGLMAAAYRQVASPPKELDWEYANLRVGLPDMGR